MPNKKTKTVKIRHLECFSAIYRELALNPEYAGYEIEEAVLQVKSYIPPTVKDVDKVIERIRFSHATHKYRYPVFEGRELIDQKTLAKMAGVSRQTRFHIPFRHRAVGQQIFRNKGSRFPT